MWFEECFSFIVQYQIEQIFICIQDHLFYSQWIITAITFVHFVAFTCLVFVWRVSVKHQRNLQFLLFQLFRGNYDIYHTVTHRIIPPIKARFVRLHPRSWRSYIAIRVELYGCRARGEGLKVNSKRSLLQLVHVYSPLVQSSSFLFFTIATRVNLNNF